MFNHMLTLILCLEPEQPAAEGEQPAAEGE